MFLDNIETLSTEELIQQQIELRQKMTQAMSSGMSPNIIAQMQNMLDHIGIQVKTRAAQDDLKAQREAAEKKTDIDGTSMDIG